MKRFAFLLLLVSSFIYAQDLDQGKIKSKYKIHVKTNIYIPYNWGFFLYDVTDSTIIVAKKKKYPYEFVTINAENIKKIKVKRRGIAAIVFSGGVLISATLGIVARNLGGLPPTAIFIVFGSIPSILTAHIVNELINKNKFIINYNRAYFYEIKPVIEQYKVIFE